MAKGLTREEEVEQLKTTLDVLRQPLIDLAAQHRIYAHVQILALFMLATESARVIGIPLDAVLSAVKDFYEKSPIKVTAIDYTGIGQA